LGFDNPSAAMENASVDYQEIVLEKQTSVLTATLVFK
jgi:hypothetical protein